MLAGYWNPNNKKFNNVGDRSHVWLVGGNNANFNQNKWNGNNNNRNYGFSGRLLKNWNWKLVYMISFFILFYLILCSFGKGAGCEADGGFMKTR